MTPSLLKSVSTNCQPHNLVSIYLGENSLVTASKIFSKTVSLTTSNLYKCRRKLSLKLAASQSSLLYAGANSPNFQILLTPPPSGQT